MVSQYLESGGTKALFLRCRPGYLKGYQFSTVNYSIDSAIREGFKLLIGTFYCGLLTAGILPTGEAALGPPLARLSLI